MQASVGLAAMPAPFACVVLARPLRCIGQALAWFRTVRAHQAMTTRHLVNPEILPLLELMPTRAFDLTMIPQVGAGSEARFAFLGATARLPRLPAR